MLSDLEFLKWLSISGMVDAEAKAYNRLIRFTLFSHFVLHARNFLFGSVSVYLKHVSEI